MSAECKTCGSNNPKVRGMLSAYDCDIDFAGPASNRVSSQETSTGNGKWYCGLCPDTWHDYERRCGKERRSTTPTTQSREADVEAGIAATIKFIENGSFLCDDSPPARFAKEVVAGIRRTVHAKDILASTTPAPVGDESPSLADHFCKCDSPYYGCQVLGTPIRCERCNKCVSPTILAQHRDVPPTP